VTHVSGGYTVELGAEYSTPTNVSWKEIDPASGDDPEIFGTIKNFFWTSGSKISPVITPSTDTYKLYDFQIHEVTLKP
jgi:hypothetical protein